MSFILVCNDPLRVGCVWRGERDERVSIKSEPGKFIYCPQCLGNDFHEERDVEED
jgi:hypothetical protein